MLYFDLDFALRIFKRKNLMKAQIIIYGFDISISLLKDIILILL